MFSYSNKLVEVPLGSEGVAYVGSCLRQGAGLCAKVAETAFRDGTTFAPLPEGVSLQRAQKFTTGGLTSRRQTNAWLVDYVRSPRVGAVSGCLVFQDVWAKPCDTAIPHPNGFFQGANVYYWLKKDAVDIHAISEIFRQMKSFLLIAMYSEYLPPGESASQGRFVDESVVTDLARKTVRIFAGAYDQEGVVVWSKRA
jgi:hypothetical protein